MIRKFPKTLTLVSYFASLVAIMPNQVSAQQPLNLGRKQLQLLIKNARSPQEYQKLATYFHYQELLYRAKAQNVVRDYANIGTRYPMATKTVSRSDVARRQYEACLSKAESNATLAAHYDELLTEMGIAPEVLSSTTVSAKNPLGAVTSTAPESTLLEKPHSVAN